MASTENLIIQLRADQARLRRDLKKGQRHYNSFSNKMQKTSKVVATSLATAFGGIAVTSAITSGIRKIARFEFQMDKVAAVSGATAKEVKILSENALDLGASSKFTASEIGNLQEELARLGFSTEQIVNMTDASRKLATVADSELGESAKTVGQIINAFSLEASQAGEVANIMAESFSKSALDLTKFQTALSSVGAVASNAGFSLAETTAMIGKLVDNGIEASTAGTQLRNVFLTLIKEGLTLEQALNRVNNAEDANAEALDLFEKRAVPVVTILARMQGETNKLTKTLSDNNQELDRMVDVMEDNLLTDWIKLQSAVDGMIQKGGALNPILRKIVQSLTDIVNIPTNLFQEFENEKLNSQSKFAKLLLFFSVITGNAKGVKDTAKALEMLNEVQNKIVANKKFKFFEHNKGGFNIMNTPEMNRSAPTPTSTSDSGQATPSLDILDSKGIKKLETSLAEVPKMLSKSASDIRTNFFEVQESIRAGMFEVTKIIDQKGQELTQITLNVGDMIQGAFSALMSGFDMGGLRGALVMLQKFLGEALMTLGSALVSINTGKIALASVPPPVGIAIGAGLIAAGALLSQSASNQLENISSSSGLGGGGSSGGSFRSDAIGQTSINIPREVSLKASGKDLRAVLNISGNRQNRIG